MREGREVVHGVGLGDGEGLCERIELGDVVLAVEPDHLVALRRQVRRQVPTDEPGRAGDDGPHDVTLATRILPQRQGAASVRRTMPTNSDARRAHV